MKERVLLESQGSSHGMSGGAGLEPPGVGAEVELID